MANANEMLETLEDQVLASVRQSQDAVVKAVKTWADAGKNLVPELPSLPFSDQLPSTTELLETAFDFADRLLAAQREFASAVIDAAKPLFNGTPAPATNGTKAPAKKIATA